MNEGEATGTVVARVEGILTQCAFKPPVQVHEDGLTTLVCGKGLEKEVRQRFAEWPRAPAVPEEGDSE